MQDRRPTSWASEEERDVWFWSQVENGLIDWPDIAFKRPYTEVSDEFGRAIPAKL